MSQVLKLAKENLFYIGLVALVVVGLVVLRTSATPVASMDELDAMLASGTPTIIEFFSNT